MMILIVILLVIIGLPIIIELAVYALPVLLAVGLILILANSGLADVAAPLLLIGGAVWIAVSIAREYTPEKRAARKAYLARVKAERKIQQAQRANLIARRYSK